MVTTSHSRQSGIIGFLCARFFWRGVRVVEGARLESVYTGNGIEGSNPSLSARKSDSRASGTVMGKLSSQNEVLSEKGEP